MFSLYWWYGLFMRDFLSSYAKELFLVIGIALFLLVLFLVGLLLISGD